MLPWTLHIKCSLTADPLSYTHVIPGHTGSIKQPCVMWVNPAADSWTPLTAHSPQFSSRDVQMSKLQIILAVTAWESVCWQWSVNVLGVWSLSMSPVTRDHVTPNTQFYWIFFHFTSWSYAVSGGFSTCKRACCYSYCLFFNLLRDNFINWITHSFLILCICALNIRFTYMNSKLRNECGLEYSSSRFKFKTLAIKSKFPY
jgi:hypothetical protein